MYVRKNGNEVTITLTNGKFISISDIDAQKLWEMLTVELEKPTTLN